ncbi:MAG TPA: transcriptional regulator, partial [Ktedonobacteraceae bacterium]|nr:transcriptional regulator [Ktedonobacteraceae bacterium]
MAKPAPYTLQWSSSRQVYELVNRENATAFDLSDEHVAAWLQEIPSFAFTGRMGAYTARKETRQRGESYWYAYRKREGKLTKKYLGKTAELTLVRLEEVGQIVSAELVTRVSPAKAFPSSLSKDAHMVNKARKGKLTGDAELSPPLSYLPKQARDPLLATRLQRPRLRPCLVHRSRLNQRLAPVSLSALTLISAPAGYGKTTLVSDWLATSTLEVAWLSLKPEDNDPVRFWNYVIAALETLHPGVGAEAWAMLQSGGLLPFVPLLTPLMNNLNQITRDFVLVLEDYHVIIETTIHEALSFFLNNLPHTTHFVMTSRTMPPLHLAHLRVRGQLLELQTSDLRFTLEESAVFFSEVMELPLSGDDLQKVEKRTEGWIAGLQLAALSMQNHPDISGFITRFAGDHRYIFDYLIEEVLWRQPEPLQEFLLHTCILEQLSGSLCDALTGRRDSFAILTQLETA